MDAFEILIRAMEYVPRNKHIHLIHSTFAKQFHGQAWSREPQLTGGWVSDTTPSNTSHQPLGTTRTPPCRCGVLKGAFVHTVLFLPEQSW